MSEDLKSSRYEPIALPSESTVVAEFLPIASESELVANLRRQLEKLNKTTFPDVEWERFFSTCIAGANEGVAEKILGIHSSN